MFKPYRYFGLSDVPPARKDITEFEAAN